MAGFGPPAFVPPGLRDVGSDAYRPPAPQGFTLRRQPRWNEPQRCQACGSPDSRDAAHARGCPALPEVPLARRMRIALACEDGWRRKAEAKARGAHAG
jgi:hypothetical protein